MRPDRRYRCHQTRVEQTLRSIDVATPRTLGVHVECRGARQAAGPREGPDPLSVRDPLALPTWVRFLRETALMAALRPVTPTRRLLVGLPTAELATAVLVHGAVTALATSRSANPLSAPEPGDVGSRVSAFFGGTYLGTVQERRS